MLLNGGAGGGGGRGDVLIRYLPQVIQSLTIQVCVCGGGGGYPFVARISCLTVGHASPSRRRIIFIKREGRLGFCASRWSTPLVTSLTCACSAFCVRTHSSLLEGVATFNQSEIISLSKDTWFPFGPTYWKTNVFPANLT